MKNSDLEQFFNVHVKKIKIEIHPKIIMIWNYKNMALILGHQKFITLFWF
jgi:hypothetical protein